MSALVNKYLNDHSLSASDMTGVTVTMRDVRLAGYCGPGLRDWMEAKGFNLRDFVKNGMPAATMAATEDAHGLKVVVTAIKRAYDGS